MLVITTLLRRSRPNIYRSFTNIFHNKQALPLDEHFLWGSQRRVMHEHAGDPLKPLPRLFIVQPRQHSQRLLRAKLEEALRLAEALGGPRPEIEGKGGQRSPHLNPWVIVQQPQGSSAKWAASRQPRAGTMVSPY